jgi:hypothetical protein
MDVQYRAMDNSQRNGASATPAEEQVLRVEEAVTGGNPQGGSPPGASTASTQVQTQTAQNTAQGDAATPLETGTRQRTDAEKQRAAEAKAARTALAEQDWERQQRLLRDAQELTRFLNSGMGPLTPDQVRQIADAVTGTNNEPMEVLRSLNERLRRVQLSREGAA